MDFYKASWFNGSGKSETFPSILKKIRPDQSTHEIHIGADSQPVKDSYTFAVVLCIYRPGAGAYYFVTRYRTKEKKYRNLGVRLTRESEISILLADRVRTEFPNNIITVHADVSPDPVNKSSKYTKLQ